MNGSAMFSRTDRCISRASARSAGTYTRPARIASAGWRNETGAPSTRSSPPSGRREPGEDVEQLVLALALEGDDAEDLAGVQVERDVLELRADAQLADGEPRRARRSAAALTRAAVSPAFGLA